MWSSVLHSAWSDSGSSECISSASCWSETPCLPPRLPTCPPGCPTQWAVRWDHIGVEELGFMCPHPSHLKCHGLHSPSLPLSQQLSAESTPPLWAERERGRVVGKRENKRLGDTQMKAGKLKEHESHGGWGEMKIKRTERKVLLNDRVRKGRTDTCRALRG